MTWASVDIYKEHMLKTKTWQCQLIIRKYNQLTEIDYKNLLAELWNVLLPSNGQINLNPAPIKVKNSEHLSNLKRKGQDDE